MYCRFELHVEMGTALSWHKSTSVAVCGSMASVVPEGSARLSAGFRIISNNIFGIFGLMLRVCVPTFFGVNN